MSALHTVTIKHDPESHEFDCHDDCTATLTCPGVTSSCRCWWECADCRKAQSGMTDEQLDDYDERLWETSEAHEEEHQHIDGMWMTASNDCVTQHLESDAIYLIDSLPDGDHAVGLDIDEGFVYVDCPAPSGEAAEPTPEAAADDLGLGNWFRRTPESKAMLEVETKALAEVETAADREGGA